MSRRPDLPDGPYLVVGLARSGVAASLALRARVEEVIGVDAGAPEGLGALRDAGVELHVGADGLDLLDGVATVVKSPGVPAQAPVIATARARGMTVMGELELAWRMLANELIAVTGTNGKTTTVELIGHIHRQAGLPVAVAGNVGLALSSLVDRVDERTTVVCEASSFQLEDTLAFAPRAAVLLNVSPDHLDRHATMGEYVAAKLEIFARQGEGDLAVVPAGFDPGRLPSGARVIRFGDMTGAGAAMTGADPAMTGADPIVGTSAPEMSVSDARLLWHGESLIEIAELSLRGAHNAQNAMAAAAVCLARGIDREAVRAGLRTFPGVPHRLQELARRDGVLYVNDSKATNVASTLVALEAMAADALPVHLILGGQGKGQDFAALRPAVEKACRAVYLIGEDAPSIERALAGADIPVEMCETLERAVDRARASARAGELVLLSPGCASYDQFVDFEHRGERFGELVGAGGGAD
jgi:UDP-N-acetylmuramoylalanine--D-glutamate ligase